MDARTLHKISYGVYIITSEKNNKINGQIANTVMQAAAEPMLIAICINKQNLTHEYIMHSKKFAISILSQDVPMELIGTFGFKSGRDINKFENIKYKTDINRLPVILEHTVGYLSAEIENTMDAATHTMFIGKIVDAETFNNNIPLTYADYHTFKNGKSPKTAPTYIKEDIKHTAGSYKCSVCGYIYNPEKGDGTNPPMPFEDLPKDWKCHVCGEPKSVFKPL
ncbi:MAG: flavin reductase [Deltaproteobacteria bacterium]|nr:flavin reductase [Deltaproteobacteria bacterium]